MVRNIVSKLAGNKYAQKILEKNIVFSHYLSGVGSGGGVQDSGEKSILDFLNSKREPYCIFDVGANKGQYLNIVFNELHKKVLRYIHLSQVNIRSIYCRKTLRLRQKSN